MVKHFECKFAIRGAGHNANPGVSSTGLDGVVIDVSALNHITLSEDKKTVAVGPGAHGIKSTLPSSLANSPLSAAESQV